VTTGKGGEQIVRKAREVLGQEFPELSGRISFQMPDEKEKRHGQAMAAASLPVFGIQTSVPADSKSAGRVAKMI